MVPMGRGRHVGRWSPRIGGNDAGQSTGGRFDPGHYRGGRGRGLPPMAVARGPRDGRGGRPVMNMDPLLGRGRGGGGGGRHDFYEPPPYTSVHPPHPLLGPPPRGGLGGGGADGRFVDRSPRGGGRVPFRGGRGRMYRGGGNVGRLDGPNPSRAPPIRDVHDFGSGFRHSNNRGGAPGPTLGPERYGPLGPTMSMSSTSSAHPKDDALPSKYDVNSMGRPSDDRSESSLSFNKRSLPLPTYSSMSEMVEEGKETSGRYLDNTRSAHGEMEDAAAPGPLSSEYSFVAKKTRYEPSGSASTDGYYNSSQGDNYKNEMGVQEDRDRIEQRMEPSGSFDASQMPRHIAPFDGSGDVGGRGRHGHARRGVMYRGGGGGRMPSFARGRGGGGGGGGGGPYSYNQPYQQPNPSDAPSIAGSDGYGPDHNKDYPPRNIHGESGRGNGGPGMGMGRGFGNPSSFSSPPSPFYRGGERSYGMGSRGGRWGGRNFGRQYPMDNNSGTFAGRGDRISGGRGFSTHRSSDHHYSSRSGLHGMENQHNYSNFSEEREHHHGDQAQQHDHHHHSKQEQQQTHQQPQQHQPQHEKTQNDEKVETTASPNKSISQQMDTTPSQQIVDESIHVVPPSPPPGPPSALALARARLSDLNETMEFHYARHLQMTKEHEMIKIKVETLKTLAIGMEAFQDDLNGSLLQEEQSI